MSFFVSHRLKIALANIGNLILFLFKTDASYPMEKESKKY